MCSLPFAGSTEFLLVAGEIFRHPGRRIETPPTLRGLDFGHLRHEGHRLGVVALDLGRFGKCAEIYRLFFGHLGTDEWQAGKVCQQEKPGSPVGPPSGDAG